MNNKTFRRLFSVSMALCMAFLMTTGAFAANIATSNGDSASSSLTLSTTDDEGNPAPTAMSVTVPTALAIAVSPDGSVTTGSGAKIVNNSYGPVKVASVQISSAGGWSLTAFGDKSSLAAEKVDSKKVGFRISIGGGTNLDTTASPADTQTLLSDAITGCYMTGVGDPSKNTVDITYDAIVTATSASVTNTAIASVLFVIEWDK